MTHRQPPPRIHAIYAVAGDCDLFEASLRSIYHQVDGVTVITGYDRDWSGAERSSASIVARILSRELDPDGRVQVLIDRETNEARTRNRAMEFAAPSRKARRVRNQSDHDRIMQPPDYFLIIDADEVYEAGAIDRLREYVSAHPRRRYRIAGIRYFKRWNWRVTGTEYSISLLRADFRLPYLRRLCLPAVRRAAARIPGLPRRLRSIALGYTDIPTDVVCFHHGSYVGPRTRIVDKLASFGHAHEVPTDWVARVWDGFDPSMRDFNPAYPTLYASCEEVSVGALPPEIRDHSWPAGYLDR
jgi:hypothetical protein